MQHLRQGSTNDVRIGPAMAIADGLTPVTSLTIAGADQAEVLKNNGVATAAMVGALAAITGCDGWYDYTLTATDSGTLGQVTIVIQDASLSLPIFKDFMVLPANVYDSLYSTDKLEVDVVSISGSTSAADGYAAAAERIITGTVNAAGQATTIFVTDLESALGYTTDDALVGRTLIFTGGTTAALKDQARVITSFNGTTGSITLSSPVSVAPADTEPFVIV